MKEFWDSRYSSTDFIYGTRPNSFFKQNIDRLYKGNILLPGDGEGRNAIYAAKLGWNVTSFDYSISAKEKALQLAKENDVLINYQNIDVESFKTDKKFDLISIIFFHLSPKLRIKFHRKLEKILKPYGKIVLECFSKSQIDKKSGGPKSPELLYNKKQIEADFDYLNIELLEETEIFLDEGDFHKGPASVIRMVGKKY